MKKGTKTAIIVISVIAGCMIIFGIIGALVFNLVWKGVQTGIDELQQLNDVGVEQIQLLQAGDIEGAYESTSDRFKTNTTLEEYQEMIESSELSAIDGYSFNSFNIDNNALTLKGTITSGDNEVPIRITATRVDGEWELTSIELNPVGIDLPQDWDMSQPLDD